LASGGTGVKDARASLCSVTLFPAGPFGYAKMTVAELRRRATMKRKIALTLVTLGLIALAACNTVQGAGRDIESVGRKGKEVIN
jgi:entericidin B